MPFRIRQAAHGEWDAADAVAARAFGQYGLEHPEWIGAMRETPPMRWIGENAELLVAISGTEVIGAVGYVAPGRPRREFFPAEWAILRMLSVPPEQRGLGLGRALVEACIGCARRDGVATLGLYTSPVMKVAVPLYRRMGFEHQGAAPPDHGMPCDIYALAMDKVR